VVGFPGQFRTQKAFAGSAFVRHRRAARERGGTLPSIDVADALLDERRGLIE
jgi:hypothetical protein